MFTKLKALVGDNAEALTLLDTLEATTTSNVQTINDLEKKVAAVTETRDQYKAGNSLVKSVLGIDAVNDETIQEAIKALKGGKGDNTAEIDNLKQLLKEAKDESDGITSNYEGKIQSMALDNALANAGLGANVANEAMYGIVSNLVRDGAVFENDEIVYKKDGATLYGANKTPLNIKDRIAELKADANYSGLFKVDTVNGTNTPPVSKGAGVNNMDGMSATEMMKQGRK